jgi:rhodanese-related sulfurtransferase
LTPASHDAGPHDERMTPQDLLARIDAGEAPAILDVRSRWEYRQGHVPGAVFIPFWAVPFLGTLFPAWRVPAKREDTLVVYCGHGPRAWMAGAALRRRGFRDVQYLDGHMTGWRRAGLPLV